jgi:hypothetical protein
MTFTNHEEEVNHMTLHPAKLAAGAFLVGLLGAGGMSLASAQTDPTTTQPPATTAPADPSTGTPPADDPNCPNMGGAPGATGTGYHHGHGPSSDTSSTDTAPSASSSSSNV